MWSDIKLLYNREMVFYEVEFGVEFDVYVYHRALWTGPQQNENCQIICNGCEKDWSIDQARVIWVGGLDLRIVKSFRNKCSGTK